MIVANLTGTNVWASSTNGAVVFPAGVYECPNLGSLTVTGTTEFAVSSTTAFSTLTLSGSPCSSVVIESGLDNFWAGFAWIVGLGIAASLVRSAHRALTFTPTSDL